MEIETWEEDFSIDLLCIRNDKTLNHWNMILFFATGHLSRPESTLGGRIVTEEGRRVLFASVYGQDLSSSWKGEDGHDWNMIMSATALKREDTYTYVRTYVCRGMVSRIKGVILGPLCQDVHPLRVFDPAFTTMACTLMASKGGYM